MPNAETEQDIIRKLFLRKVITGELGAEKACAV